MMAFARAVSARGAAAAALATYSNMDEQPYRVLVVGAGLGGCLAAKELRRRFGDAAELHVWERATYTAGRLAPSQKRVSCVSTSVPRCSRSSIRGIHVRCRVTASPETRSKARGPRFRRSRRGAWSNR